MNAEIMTRIGIAAPLFFFQWLPQLRDPGNIYHIYSTYQDP